MEPIISPWLVYVIMQVDDIKTGLGIIAAIASLPIALMLGMWLIEKKEGYKYPSILSVFTVITFVFLCMFIPSKDGLIAIIAATYATPDTLQLGADAAMSIRDMVKADIVDVLTAITNTTQ